MRSFSAGPTFDELELIDSDWLSEDEIIRDDVPGDPLDPSQVREGQRLEMDWLARQNMFNKVPLKRAFREHGRLHRM